MKCRCINPRCENTIEVSSGDPGLKACSPECKAEWEKDWAEAGDGFHFPLLNSTSITEVLAKKSPAS